MTISKSKLFFFIRRRDNIEKFLMYLHNHLHLRLNELINIFDQIPCLRQLLTQTFGPSGFWRILGNKNMISFRTQTGYYGQITGIQTFQTNSHGMQIKRSLNLRKKNNFFYNETMKRNVEGTQRVTLTKKKIKTQNAYHCSALLDSRLKGEHFVIISMKSSLGRTFKHTIGTGDFFFKEFGHRTVTYNH